jgi:hypothetical protein
MPDISLGIVIVLIAVLGYVSNLLNWRYLNYGIVRLLYYLGAFVHETSHAALCILTGAKIEKFTVFSGQPQVVHQRSRLPFIGEVLISFAPIAGGLLFLFIVNRYLLGNYFALPQLSNWHGWQSIFAGSLKLLLQIDLFQWQSWVTILLFFNIGAMLGPSSQDLKNVWLALIVLFFVRFPLFVSVGLMAISLIVINIIFQVVVVALLKTVAWIRY